jgi:hypothetical protein
LTLIKTPSRCLIHQTDFAPIHLSGITLLCAPARNARGHRPKVRQRRRQQRIQDAAARRRRLPSPHQPLLVAPRVGVSSRGRCPWRSPGKCRVCHCKRQPACHGLPNRRGSHESNRTPIPSHEPQLHQSACRIVDKSQQRAGLTQTVPSPARLVRRGQPMTTVHNPSAISSNA